MSAYDRALHEAKALVVDPNPTSRSVMATQLRSLGVGEVRQLTRVKDARYALEQTAYDIVLCERVFANDAMSGQDLLDELRREQLLPYKTVFIIVTSDATYSQVMEAAEATVDGYLVKPYSGAVLAERLAEVRKRKATLNPIYAAMRKGEIVQAATLAQKRYDDQERYGAYACQVAVELWLRAEQPAKALALCQKVLASRPQNWAKAGIARARMAAGEWSAARRHLEALVEEEPGFADAQDLLGRVLVEVGDFEAALERYRTASNLTPGCLLRLQSRGTLAFYCGAAEEAIHHLERALSMGRNSKLFDALSLLNLALLYLDKADGRAMAFIADQLRQMAAAFPESLRLQRMVEVVGALQAIQAGDPATAAGIATQLGQHAADAAFDLEAAAITLTLWSRLPQAETALASHEDMLRQIGLRFAISHAALQVLLASAGRQSPAAEVLRECHQEISAFAEQALNRSLHGQAAASVQMLLEKGEQTRNAKLIDMASAVARRHAKAIEDIGPLTERIRLLQASWCQPISHLAGIRRTARTPGALVLRD